MARKNNIARPQSNPKGKASLRHQDYVEDATLFAQSLHDPQMANLGYEIALCDTMIAKALEAMNQGDAFSSSERKEFLSAFKLLKAGLARSDSKKRQEGLERLNTLAQRSNDQRGWSEELRNWVEQRRKLAESGVKVSQAVGTTIPAEHLNLALALLLASLSRAGCSQDIINQAVTDVKPYMLRLSGLAAVAKQERAVEDYRKTKGELEKAHDTSAPEAETLALARMRRAEAEIAKAKRDQRARREERG